MENTEYQGSEEFAEQKEAARMVGKFYRDLALLQMKAIRYVAHGGTPEDKNDRIQDVIRMVEEAGVKIDYEEKCPPIPVLEPCQIPPCYREEGTGKCLHD